GRVVVGAGRVAGVGRAGTRPVAVRRPGGIIRLAEDLAVSAWPAGRAVAGARLAITVGVGRGAGGRVGAGGGFGVGGGGVGGRGGVWVSGGGWWVSGRGAWVGERAGVTAARHACSSEVTVGGGWGPGSGRVGSRGVRVTRCRSRHSPASRATPAATLSPTTPP